MMFKKEEIKITLSKRKLILSFVGALLFVIVGGWFMINPPLMGSPFWGFRLLVHIVGGVAFLFFGFIALRLVPKLSDKHPGLVVNAAGITDNSSAVSAGLISWKNIKEIDVKRVWGKKFLRLVLRNPKDFIEDIKNPIIKRAVKINYQRYGSPVTISTTILKVDFSDLRRLLLEYAEEYKV